MAVIHDVIPAFELFQPTTVDDALALQSRHGAKAWVLAGGLDSFDWFKDRIKRPEVVYRPEPDQRVAWHSRSWRWLEIGAMTTLTEVVRHPMVREKYSILPHAAERPPPRRFAIRGRSRQCFPGRACWYYRGGWPCYRAGGNIAMQIRRRA